MSRYVTLSTDGAVDVVYLYDPRPEVDATEVPDTVHAGWRNLAGAWTAPSVELPTPAQISRRQCAEEAYVQGYVTGAEAIAWTGSATPPAAIQTAFEALSEPDRTLARINFAAATYERSHPLVAEMVRIIKPAATDTDIDAFFRAADQR